MIFVKGGVCYNPPPEGVDKLLGYIFKKSNAQIAAGEIIAPHPLYATV